MFAAIHAREKTAALFECAQSFSPHIEQTVEDTVTLDAGGLEHLFGSAHDIANAIARRATGLGFSASIAIAGNPDAAVYAARGFFGISIIPQDDEAKYLATLPVTLLPLTPEMEETFSRWGIRTFHDLAALPEIGVAARLGNEGVRLQKLARGEGDRPLVPAEPPASFEEEMELEYPVALLEPLSFILARLLGQLCERLEARALAAIEIRWRLKEENDGEHARSLRLPVPMRDAKVFLKLMELDLNEHPPQAPVVKVWVSAESAKPRVTQNGLFVPLAPEPERLELTLARIARVVGEGNVGSPELVDTYRPRAFRMKRFASHVGQAFLPVPHKYLALRLFTPPPAAKVHSGYIEAGAIRGRIMAKAGPWRTSGDWWTSHPWNRDEWDIEIAGAGIYRVYCDFGTGRWFIEGSYD